MLRWLTAGESHGQALAGIIDGLPAGLGIDSAYIDRQLARRQGGYGRGGRMRIERDRVCILAGVRHGYTLGSPVALLIENRDWVNWQEAMSVESVDSVAETITRPRPGHADLAGSLKYGHRDIRNVLERSSARATAVVVALGALARRIMDELGIEVMSHLRSVGAVVIGEDFDPWERLTAIEASPLYCGDARAEQAMMAAIDEAAAAGDTLGGVFEVRVRHLHPGLGSYVQSDRRLEGALAQALMAIPAIRGVEVGLGFAAACRPGSGVHDPISWEEDRHDYTHAGNNAGGIEGGMSNGEEIILRAAMKPIPTLVRPLPSVDMLSKRPEEAHSERSDVCAVPAAAVVAEAEVSLVIARALLEKHGGDSMEELRQNYSACIERNATR